MENLEMENILFHSVKDTFSGRIKTILLGCFGSAFGIFLLGKEALDYPLEKSILCGVIILVIIFFIRFLYFLCKHIVKYIHHSYVDSIYGQAIVDLKDANAYIHALRKKEKIEDEEFMEVMVNLCNTIKNIFDRKTKADCSVSIKVALSNPEPLENIILKNLCRDQKHSKRNTDKYNKTKHTIIGNTPYRVIVNNILKNNKKKFGYVNNDIENSKDYENTSKDVYENGVLPYKSELVYPIIPSRTESPMKHKMYGFICVDCAQKDKFDESRYDIPMIEGIADNIYDIIQKKMTLNYNQN